MMMMKWNVNNFKKPEIRNAYRMRFDKQAIGEEH